MLSCTETLKGKEIQDCCKAIKKKSNALTTHAAHSHFKIWTRTLFENVDQMTPVAAFKLLKAMILASSFKYGLILMW